MKNCLSISMFFCVLIAISSGQAAAQNLSNRGTDFWVGYGHHQYMETGNANYEMVLYFSAEQAANVTVRIEGTAWIRNYAVAAGTVIASEFMPKGAGGVDPRLMSPSCGFIPVTPCGGEGLFSNKAIHITSDIPIVAYAHIFGSASSGATMLMPVETWGYSYITLNSRQSYQPNCYSWAYVIAQHDNTAIEVTPTQLTRAGRVPNVPFTVTLNRGQIFQFMAGPQDGPSAKPELSGTKIKSIANSAGECYPIAVFAGSSRTYNPISCGSGGGDNDNQQVFPTQAWGKRYLTAPTSRSTSAAAFMTNSYKIAVKDPTTIVRRNGVQIPLASLQANSFYFFESSTADLIEADKPIMVGQFMTGGGCMGGGVGDPEMMYISPVEQGIKRVGFYRNNRESITTNYLTLVIPTPGLSSLVIDGSGTFDHTYPHPNQTGYTIVVKRWNSAQAQAIAQSDSAFTAITYGLGSVESYGYNAGTLINNLSAVGSIFNVSDTSATTTSHPFTCTNTPVKLAVLLGYATPPTRLVWRLSTVGGGLTPNTDVTDNSPTPVGTQMVNGVLYSKYELPGTYTFSTVGTFRVPIQATHPSVENCNNTEELYYDIEVRGKPSTNFAINHTGCLLDTVHFVGETTSANGFNINQWLYTFHDATTSISKDTAKLYAMPGTYNVNLRIVSTEGCVADTTKEVVIGSAPLSSFTADDPTVCQGTAINFNSTAAYAGITNYYWDFGDGTIMNTASSAPQAHTYATHGVFVVRHAISVGPVCVSDTATINVTVSALPTTSFNYPAGCLPATGVVQFNSMATTPDGQTITNHLWTFGDPPSGPANTSALPNPSHTYPGFGSYTITYQTTTNNGCVKDTTVNATFNLAPAFTYPALNDVCQNLGTTVNVAIATVTNGVPGSGIYNGPGTTTAGIFDPAIAGAGTHTIWYVYTATSGCIDSVSQTITVDPTPDASFTIAGSGCLPTSGIVNFNYTGTAQAGQTYGWNFGDPASGANNTSTLQNPLHNYTSGTYTIILTITNPATGCIERDTITQTFSVTPAVNFPALPATCENLTNVNVATATVTNGVTGTGVYSGTGVSAAGILDPSVAGPGTHQVIYTFTSATGNCVGADTTTIVVNAKPNASFTYPTAACLPTTGLANFTYNGSMTAGQTYLWNFGDPASGANNTSALQNPSHIYTNTGVYSVSVAVTNTNGCVDDSVINNITFSVTPALTYPALAAVCSNDALFSIANATVTNGVSGTGVYSGPGTDAAGNFNPATAGPGTHTITYTFTSTGNCVSTITRTIQVNPAPTATFTASTAACLPANGNVAFTYTGTVQAGQTYLWNFGDPASGANNTSTLANPSHNFAEGGYQIILTVTNPATGCVDKDTLNAIFALTPALNYPALTATCENLSSVNVATATVTNGVPGTGVYSGPGITANGTFNPSIAGAGTHTITYTFTSSSNCVATITSSIAVNAKPNASFTYPTAACLPPSGIANFTYNGSMSAGQTYLWNFGDPASGANNTSSLQNPSHTYTNTGTYSVSVTVTNTNGCVDGSVINNIVFSVTPALSYPALLPVCENETNVNVATATVTNGVTGAGVYSGTGVSVSGIFNPSVAGAGTHTITYTFTSTGNCVSTQTSSITVNPKPVSVFTITPAVCQGQTANITSNATIPSGTITEWRWYMGDGNTYTYSNGNNFTHTYANYGTYEVKLVTISNNGCISDTARESITVSPVPVVAFSMPASVCMPNGTVQFTNNTTIADNSSLIYSWNFGDGSGTSAAVNPSHVYAASGSYPVTLTATGANGCNASSSQTFDDFFDKPIAAFTSSVNQICSGQSISFTDASSAPNSSIASRQWLLGDGTGATTTNPTHTYANSGDYRVKLVVASTEGCVSDTAFDNIQVYVQPVLDAGPSFVVAQGTLVQFAPVVNDSTNVTYTWSPVIGLSNPNILRPTLAAIADQTYTLTGTSGSGLCTASDMLTVKILRPIKIPNAFSPNGDNVNDTWEVENLIDYTNCVVEVFNRYGQQVYRSNGYGTPWNGNSNGKPLPVATYYYIIQLNNGFKPLSGSITIIR